MNILSGVVLKTIFKHKNGNHGDKYQYAFPSKERQSEQEKPGTYLFQDNNEVQRFEWSTQRYIEEVKWSQPIGKVKGASEEPKSINAYLELMKHKVFFYQKELILEQREISIWNFKSKWFGSVDNSRMT